MTDDRETLRRAVIGAMSDAGEIDVADEAIDAAITVMARRMAEVAMQQRHVIEVFENPHGLGRTVLSKQGTSSDAARAILAYATGQGEGR